MLDFFRRFFGLQPQTHPTTQVTTQQQMSFNHRYVQVYHAEPRLEGRMINAGRFQENSLELRTVGLNDLRHYHYEVRYWDSNNSPWQATKGRLNKNQVPVVLPLNLQFHRGEVWARLDGEDHLRLVGRFERT